LLIFYYALIRYIVHNIFI